MTFAEFEALVEDIFLKEGPFYSYPDKGVIKVQWETGGFTGGSCWGTAPYAYTSNEDPKDLDLVDAIILQIRRDMPFLEYKALRHLIKHEDYTEYEYYGNYTEYKTNSI